MEASDGASATIERTQCFRNSLIYAKEGMCSLLKMFKLPSMFNEMERRNAINKPHALHRKNEDNHHVAASE